MTINNVLHTLWTNSVTDGKLDKAEAKRLWMTLQRFVEEKGGLDAPAENYNPTGKPLSQTGRS